MATGPLRIEVRKTGRSCFCGCGRELGWVDRRVSKRGARVVGCLAYLEEYIGPIQTETGLMDNLEEFIEAGEDFANALQGVVHGDVNARAVNRRALNKWLGLCQRIERKMAVTLSRSARDASRAAEHAIPLMPVEEAPSPTTAGAPKASTRPTPSLPSNFEGDVRTAQEEWVAFLESNDAPRGVIDPFTRDDVPRHAQAIGDCVERFATLEREGRVEVGRYPPGPQMFPALANVVDETMQSADEREVEELIRLGIAQGYVFLSAAEDTARLKIHPRTPAQLWNLWAPNFNTGVLEMTECPEDFISDGREDAACFFRDDATALGLRDAEGACEHDRLYRLGGYYAQAGMVLRAVQTSPPLKPAHQNPWDYDAYPYAETVSHARAYEGPPF